MIAENSRPTARPNWRQIALFLGLVFGLTYSLDLALYLTMGYGANSGITIALQLQMLIPATVAIVLQLFFFKNSSIYHTREKPRWFFYVYLGYVLFQLVLAVSLLFVSNQMYQMAASALIQVLLLGMLAFIIILRLVSGKEAFQRAGLQGGKVKYWLGFGLLIVLIYGVATGLDVLFGLGQAVNVKEVLSQAAGGQAAGLEMIPDFALLLLVGAQAVILGPILGLPLAFGEEYGWRGYLQGELVKMGKVKGILLLGVIWGLWHAPVVAMGHQYPGRPLEGIIMMTLYTIALAFIFGYATLKSGSVWLAAYLHALNNQLVIFLMAMVYRPSDTFLSFGVGVYGLVVWAVVIAAILVLGRKEWTSPARTTPEIEIPKEELAAPPQSPAPSTDGAEEAASTDLL
jgi:membrane protease YdiL (CAAX protease family)